ncbi:hypothetical protein [Pseudonocardia alaniniphila]|uniref:Glycosyl hydrolase family 76 n=1 Tax=Pseudonocardia alaniniphila TaxID=75291 RepID=A0ABS9TD19_9PSEU|nr:hypothetical protein [Pseudonocardia alaniniphila]MCH6166434.1 hypothetical protein [Pseudonocardia alaniniphila]
MDPVSCVNPIYQGYLYNNRWAITDFWTRANTLDAAIHFVNAAYSKWPAQTKQWYDGMATRLGTGTQPQTEDKFFQPMLDDVGVWDDDFAWCGLASLSAYDFLFAYDLSGGHSHAAVYLDIAQTCWLRMVGTGYDLATEVMPVPHGCRNSSASASSNPMGVKNTVTNAGFFLLSLRLYSTLKTVTPQKTAAAQGYLKMAYAQYQWFSRWFTEPNLSQYQYLKLVTFNKGVMGGLVNERPLPDGTYNSLDNPPYEPGCVWSGDQGLILAALAGMLEIADELAPYVQAHVDPTFDKTAFTTEVTTWIGQIAGGVQQLLVGTDGIVREAPFKALMSNDSTTGFVFSKDYVSGRGVLLRCLALPEVKTALSAAGISFDDTLNKTANAVCASLQPGPANQVNVTFGVADTDFQATFKNYWKFGDGPIGWTFDPSQDGLVGTIVQAVGLDAIGAAIPLQ